MIYVFDNRHHQDFSSAQSMKVKFELGTAVETATILIGYGLQLTMNL